MDDETKGAWLVHHSQKLSHISGAVEYDEIQSVGKAITLLTSLAESQSESRVSRKRCEAIASSCGINRRLELPGLLNMLDEAKVIDQTRSQDGDIAVLGITPRSALVHGARIFNSCDPSPAELSSIDLAEAASETPLTYSDASNLIATLPYSQSHNPNDIVRSICDVGIVDHEGSGADSVLFNGNLFRKGETAKTVRVLDSLTIIERQSVIDVEQGIYSKGCIELDEAKAVLGEPLWMKLNSIAYFDVLSVENQLEHVYYVAKPGSYSKFGNPFIEDALDLAKAFTASLMYGMTRSSSMSGRIQMIHALMRKLIRGEWVGPATAIGRDYQILETRGVVKTKPHDSMFMMQLLKPEIGEIALQALTSGAGASTTVAATLSGASVTQFQGPESHRQQTRKRSVNKTKQATRDILEALRTGG